MGAEDFVKLSVRAYIEMAAAGVSPKAELAFYRGIQYCGAGNTHGVVPASHLGPLGTRAAADELVAAGFWEPMPNGWRYVAWDKWQYELEQLHAKRAKDAERKRRDRRKARDTDFGLTEGGDDD